MIGGVGGTLPRGWLRAGCLGLLAALLALPSGSPALGQSALPVGLRAIDGSTIVVRWGDDEVPLALAGLAPLVGGGGLESERVALLDRLVRGQLLRVETCDAAEGAAGYLVGVLGEDDVRTWVNEALVLAGLAQLDGIEPGDGRCRGDALVSAQQNARGARRGIWVMDPPPPIDSTVPRRHDWRSPGHVGVLGGTLYDPGCRPLRSAGSNLPNLLFRDGWTETLDWMRLHQLRWMRVFATGHGPGIRNLPRSVADVSLALRALLAHLEAYNAAHPPSESIYVLVVLTDYYAPGVPGDRYAYDNPHWGEEAVLPAPWYRPGGTEFDFEQEHGRPRMVRAPNYEVNYKPWVRTLVRSVAHSPALLGWQLGNELKARGSVRNNIDPADAYQWYLDFTQDMVDLIREVDQNHLIFQGVQYLAEATDWGYRVEGTPDPLLVAAYRALGRRALEACGAYCWNVWSLTNYDFSTFALDDAAFFAEHGVASVVTEYGFTRGTVPEMQARFGGDRVMATRHGLGRAWVDLYGRFQPRHWGAAELVDRASLAGIAPWGSPAPGPSAGFDADLDRGITGTPEELGLWRSWRDIGSQLEARNRQAGVSALCLATDSRRVAAVPGP